MIQLNNDTEEQMMKKPILIISLALLLPGLVRAQEAFNSLSIGLEVGTTGIGVELAMPLVTDHLVLKGGLTAPSLSIPYSTTVDASGFNGMLDDVNSQLAASGVSDRIDSRFGDVGVDASAVLNLSSAKLLLEYYPFRKSSFHLVAGAYFGMGTGNLVSLRAQSDTRFLSDLDGLRAELEAINEKYASVPGYESIEFPEPAFNLCGTSYGIGEDDGRAVLAADISVAKVRPYFGIGVGRSAPKGHVGFQFEIGAWYHGRPSIVSEYALAEYNPDAPGVEIDERIFDYLSFYPNISLRLIYRIF